jgi:hypothetical protein
VGNNNSGLAQITQSRPLLAILSEDYPKLKEIHNNSETDALINYLLTILNIKVSNENEAKDLQIQMLVVSDFLKSKFGFLTVEEIKEAFKMFVAREFPDIKVFRILDCVAIGEVLQSYTNFRNESLRTYIDKKKVLLSAPPPKTNEEKKQIRLKFIEMLYEEIKKDKFSDSAWLLYDELYNSGKIKITDDEKKELYNKQLLVFATEQRTEIAKKSTRSKDFDLSKSLLQDLNKRIQSGNPIQLVINKCKNIIVCDYLKKNMYDFEDFKKSILE